jgi:hypothetical protein
MAVDDVGPGGAALAIGEEEEAQDGRGQPHNGRQEGERNDRLRLAARIAQGRHVAPVEDRTAGIADQLQDAIRISYL